MTNQLPIVANCDGCGVCCFHMGYPAFVLPREPMSDQAIDADESLVQKIKRDPKLREDLKSGHAGEVNWHRLPPELKTEWEAFVAQYQSPDYGDTTESLDGPCFWLDMTTRRCKHHQYRPNVCRDFEAGSSQCQQWRRHYADRIKEQ